MTASTRVSVWVFAGESTAQRSVHRLGLLAGRGLSIDDLGVVSWPPGRDRPLAWQAREIGDTRRLSGAFWGLLFASLFLLPLSLRSGPSLADGHADVADWPADGLTRLGLDASLAAAVREQVVSGTSALFVIESVEDPGLLARAMPAAAHEVADRYLTPEQLNRLHAGFDD